MNIIDSMTLYKKYLRIQSARVDLESAGEKSEEICERLQDLADYPETSEKWCDAVEYAVGETVEYINLCVYLCRGFGDGRCLIIPDVINAVVDLCSLKYNIACREDMEERRVELIEIIDEAVCDAGNSVRIQDEKYWLCISKMFELDGDCSIRSALDADLALLASGKEIKDEEIISNVSEVKDDTESVALKILGEAMKLPNPQISTSWVQRRFNYGYGKAAKIIDWLEAHKYVQSHDDMKAEGLHARRILVSKDKL